MVDTDKTTTHHATARCPPFSRTCDAYHFMVEMLEDGSIPPDGTKGYLFCQPPLSAIL